MIQASSMPQHLPPTAHIHQMNCVLPQSALDAYGQHDPYFPDMRIKKLLADLTGRNIPQLKKGFGHRYQFSEFYTLENEHGHVLAVV